MSSGTPDIKKNDIALRNHITNIITVINEIYHKESTTVRYKNVIAQYDPKNLKSKKALFRIGTDELTLSREYFLVFKCLVENRDNCVPTREIASFMVKNGIKRYELDITGKYVRTTISRMREHPELDKLFIKCKQGDGYKFPE